MPDEPHKEDIFDDPLTWLCWMYGKLTLIPTDKPKTPIAREDIAKAPMKFSIEMTYGEYRNLTDLIHDKITAGDPKPVNLDS